MPYWIWISAGLIILACELFVPMDFFLFFIGLGGIATGLLVSAGVLDALEYQLLVFALLTPVFLYYGRKWLSRLFKKNEKELSGTLEGSKVKLLMDIPPNQSGKGKLRGTSWTVKNETSEVLQEGKSYQVSESGGTSLIVRSVEE